MWAAKPQIQPNKALPRGEMAPRGGDPRARGAPDRSLPKSGEEYPLL